MAATIVQHRIGKATGSGTFSTAAMDTTSGNTLVLVYVWQIEGTVTRPTHIDSEGNTLVPIGSVRTVANSGFTSALAVSIVAGDNMAGGEGHTVSQSHGVSNYGTMVLIEIAGADPTNPLAGIFDNGDAASPYVSTSFTPTAADCLILSALQAGDSTAMAAASPLTALRVLNYPADVDFWGMAVGYQQQVGAAAAVTPTWTATGGYASSLQTLAIKPAASPGRTAVLNATLSGPTLAAAAKVAIGANLGATLNGPTLSSTGKVAINATLSATLTGPSLAASATLTANGLGAVNATLTGPTLAATAKVAINAAVNAQLSGPSLSAIGKLPIAAGATLAMTGPSLDAVGKVAIAGVVNGTLSGPTLQATGALQGLGSGSVNAQLSGPSLAAFGNVAINAALNGSISGPSLAATGKVAINAAVSAQLSGPSLSAVGTVTITGNLFAQLSGPTLQAAGVLSGDVVISPQVISVVVPARAHALTVAARISAFTVPKR